MHGAIKAQLQHIDWADNQSHPFTTNMLTWDPNYSIQAPNDYFKQIDMELFVRTIIKFSLIFRVNYPVIQMCDHHHDISFIVDPKYKYPRDGAIFICLTDIDFKQQFTWSEAI